MSSQRQTLAFSIYSSFKDLLLVYLLHDASELSWQCHESTVPCSILADMFISQPLSHGSLPFYSHPRIVTEVHILVPGILPSNCNNFKKCLRGGCKEDPSPWISHSDSTCMLTSDHSPDSPIIDKVSQRPAEFGLLYFFRLLQVE